MEKISLSKDIRSDDLFVDGSYNIQSRKECAIWKALCSESAMDLNDETIKNTSGGVVNL